MEHEAAVYTIVVYITQPGVLMDVRLPLAYYGASYHFEKQVHGAPHEGQLNSHKHCKLSYL